MTEITIKHNPDKAFSAFGLAYTIIRQLKDVPPVGPSVTIKLNNFSNAQSAAVFALIGRSFIGTTGSAETNDVGSDAQGTNIVEIMGESGMATLRTRIERNKALMELPILDPGGDFPVYQMERNVRSVNDALQIKDTSIIEVQGKPYHMIVCNDDSAYNNMHRIVRNVMEAHGIPSTGKVLEVTSGMEIDGEVLPTLLIEKEALKQMLASEGLAAGRHH